MTELNESERKELEEVLCDAPLSSEGEAAVLIPFINHLLVQREAAAYEAAAQLADEWFRTCRTEPRVKPTAEGIQILAVRIRALTPADAQAALDNLLDERARVEFEGGIRVATEELRGGALRQEHPALVEFRAALQSAVRESAKGLREALSYYAASQSYKHGTLSQPKVIEDSGVIATKALATHAAQFPPAEESNIFNLEYANQKDFYDKHGK